MVFMKKKGFADGTILFGRIPPFAQATPRVWFVLKYAIRFPCGAPYAHLGIASPTE
jgi:hypothetical protein